MTDLGPKDLSARFAFGSGRDARVRAERREREATLIAFLKDNAETLSDEDALRMIRETSIGTVRKTQLREAWLGGCI